MMCLYPKQENPEAGSPHLERGHLLQVGKLSVHILVAPLLVLPEGGLQQAPPERTDVKQPAGRGQRQKLQLYLRMLELLGARLRVLLVPPAWVVGASDQEDTLLGLGSAQEERNRFMPCCPDD